MTFRPWHLRKINCILMLLIGAVLCLLLALLFFRSDVQPLLPSVEVKKEWRLPSTFHLPEKAYSAIDEQFFRLEKGLSATTLPDLRTLFVSYGKIQRPGSKAIEKKYLIGIRGKPSYISAFPNEKIYLQYDQGSSLHKWSFSKDNIPTSIWLQIEETNGQITAFLFMKDLEGNVIQKPKTHAQFILNEVPLLLTPETLEGWTIGSMNVDRSFLEQQNARWYGKDAVLQEYGGKEYEDEAKKEHIEFHSGKKSYSIYGEEGSLFSFNEEDDRWEEVAKGDSKATEGKHLLEVAKVSDSTLSFVLWDAEGTKKLPLDLHKLPDLPPGLFDLNIKLIGALSREVWITEIEGQRLTLKADDWFLIKDRELQKITTEDELDEYLKGLLSGELLVLEEVSKTGGEIALLGKRFNSMRTKYIDVRIPMSKASERLMPQIKPHYSPRKRGAHQAPYDFDDEELDDENDFDDEDFDDEN